MENIAPEFSVVLRVHNEGTNVNSSVESVLNQTFHDFELIIIDDGSERETADILDKYDAISSKIRVVHQGNIGGLGAMLRGIREACGNYLAFLDAGDEYEPEYLATAENILRKYSDSVDMVAFGLREVFSNRDRTFCIIEGEKIFTPSELVKLMEKTVSFFGLAYKVTARKAFRYTVDEEQTYERLGANGNFGDDLYLLSPIFRNINSIYVTDKPLYIYNYNSESLSHWFPEYTWQDAWNRCKLVEFIYNTYNNSGFMDKELEEYIQNHALTLLRPAAKWIVRHAVKDEKIQRMFYYSSFYNGFICNKRFRCNFPANLKDRVALAGFRLMTRF